MDLIMKEVLKMVNFMVEEHIVGLMEVNMMVNGLIIKWMVKEKCYGKIKENT